MRIHVIPNAVDTSRFRPDWRVRAEVRSSLGARDDRLQGLFVGGDWYHKGLPIALEALALAVGAVGDVAGELWVVGGGDSRRMTYLARQLGIEQRIRFLGFRRDTERFYQAADVFLLPTAYESFSIATHEAAACGLPLLVPRVNGVAELIDAGGGLVVQREPTSIAAALCRLAEDPDLRAELGRAARRRAEQFSWERAASEVARSYREVMEVA
jgi:UDP-glucose:(heptosyl)LPS alpha-1,3-glucosyltransferase